MNTQEIPRLLCNEMFEITTGSFKILKNLYNRHKINAVYLWPVISGSLEKQKKSQLLSFVISFHPCNNAA
jgi:hypothetical protein